VLAGSAGLAWFDWLAWFPLFGAELVPEQAVTTAQAATAAHAAARLRHRPLPRCTPRL
jgi:hypothetical protein